jgi:hypothetical protein
MDEASLSPYEAFQILMARLREASELGWLSATFTAKGLTHWTYDVFGKAVNGEFTVKARTEDNPFLSQEFIDEVKRRYVGLQARQELEGEFIATQGAEWPPEYFPQSIWFSDFPTDVVLSGLALDPSMGKGERAKGCYSAFVYGALDKRGCLWLEAWMSQAWDASQLVDRMYELTGERQPTACSVETNGGQEFLAKLIIETSRQKGRSLPLFGICNTENKEVRIRAGIGPRLARSEFRFRDTPGTRLLVSQLRDFPVGEFVDGPDALEQLGNLLLHLMQGRRSGGNFEAIR